MSTDPRDVDPRYSKEQAEQAGRAEKVEQVPAPKKPAVRKAPAAAPTDGLNLGAFHIFDRMHVFLDYNFASALSAHILQNGSDNRAILAFGHQLAKAAGDD